MADDAALVALEPLCRWVVREYFPPPGASHDDLMQEARIGAWKALRDFRQDGGSSLHSFAKLCIQRQVITFVKASTRQKHEALNTATALDKPTGDDDGSGTVADIALRSDAGNPERRLIHRERLRDALELLRMDVTTLERRCFIAVEVDGMTYVEVAAALRIEEKAVDNALQRVRRKLDNEAAEPTCGICGTAIEWGRRCKPCDDEIEFAKGLLAA